MFASNLARFLTSLTFATGAHSAVHRGVAFEERCLRILQNSLSMTLHRIGGRSDGGVDLQGWWWLPTSEEALHQDHTHRRRIRVLAQCKAEKKKISPKYVREMEGVLLHHLLPSPEVDPANLNPDSLPTQDPRDPVVGLFVSSSPFTKATLLRATASPLPFMLLHIPTPPRAEDDVALPIPPQEDDPTDSDDDPELGSIVLNPALGSSAGLLAGEIEARWEYSQQGPNLARPALWWKGERIPSWTPELHHV